MTEEEKEIQGKVLWISPSIKEFNGLKNIGIKISGQDVFFNKYDEEAELQKLINTIKKGFEIKFNANNRNEIEKIEIISNKVEENTKGTNKSFSEDMTTFEDLLTSAHKKFGNKISIESNPVLRKIKVGDDYREEPMIDFEKKTALFKARIVIRDSMKTQIFEAHGDSTIDNIDGKFVKPHFIRMAETRAISRALRFATNNAACSIEETEQGKLSDNPETNGV